MQPHYEILVLGAGPTGLGAAWRLLELNHSSWHVCDAADTPGGLASSIVDENGFTWDLGGHVLFSHYEYFDRTMDELLGDAWIEHIREAWVWIRSQFIPYPFQNNIWRLPPEDLVPCLKGLLDVHASRGMGPPPKNFEEWILQAFGRGLADVFMLPYNFKVWAYPPSRLATQWMGERVATVDLGRILENLVLRRDECAWGPNSRFRFPLRGGTGAIWRALGARLPRECLTLSRRAVRIDTAGRTVHFSDGSTARYDSLISTLPLDALLRVISDRPDLGDAPGQFLHSSSHIIGVGIAGQVPEVLRTKCWMYFPEPDTPFYRVTVFSNYSPNNVPHPGQEWSLMAEVSESPEKPVNSATIMDETIAGMRCARLLPESARIVSTFHQRLEHGYPTPFLGRDALLSRLDPELRGMNIHSRGRFGGWKYEVSNQDHSFMQGVEAVDHILLGAEETTYHYPAVVNASKGLGRRPMHNSSKPALRDS